MSGLIAVDLGNTEAKFGLFEDRDLQRVLRLPTGHLRDVRTGADLLSRTPGLAQWLDATHAVALGSVVSWAGAKLSALLTGLGCQVQAITSLESFGLQIDYEHGEPGVDRTAACAAAYGESGGPLLVVGAGTALHTNVVNSEGVYLGGAIMPGLNLMTASLSSGTDQVRTVTPVQPRRAIGKSTPECVEIGIYYAWLGGALTLVKRTLAEMEGEPHLWLTGGQSAFLEPHLAGSRIDPHLSLKGLAGAFLSSAAEGGA